MKSTVRIVELTEAFSENQELRAVGVVDEAGRTLGVVNRDHLLAQLSRPFGRDILSRKSVADVVERVQTFDPYTNIYAASSQLGDLINDGTLRWFLVQNHEGHFKGVFSSKDLLVYLSRITQEDIGLARDLQGRMVRLHDEWSGKDWVAQAFTRPALGVGGDLYFHADMGEGKHFFAVGDVSGEGVAASILTSLLWGILRSWDYAQGLKTLLLHINRLLLETFQLEKYMTGFFLVFDEKKKTLQFADMGHGHGLLIRKGKVKSLQPPDLNLPLGIEVNLDPKLYRLELKPGDLVAVWTDGITEQEGAVGGEYGEDRMARLLLEKGKAVDIPLLINDEVEAWRGAVPQQDDMTWLQISVAR